MEERIADAFQRLFDEKIRRSKGARREALFKAKANAAQRLFLTDVWWRVFGSFNDLEPEYEVIDEKDGPRYLDFASFKGGVKLGIEIDGYGPHWRDVGHWRFNDHLMRQNQLIIDGWDILRFSYMAVSEQARSCQQVLLRYFGARTLLFGNDTKAPALKAEHMQILQIAHDHPIIKAKQITEMTGMPARTVNHRLRKMTALGLLEPAWGERARIKGYRLAEKSRATR